MPKIKCCKSNYIEVGIGANKELKINQKKGKYSGTRYNKTWRKPYQCRGPHNGPQVKINIKLCAKTSTVKNATCSNSLNISKSMVMEFVQIVTTQPRTY